jgi:hypothetical protein
MKLDNLTDEVELDYKVGIELGASGELTFDTNKLAELVAELGSMVKDARAKAIAGGVAAALTLFSVKSNLKQGGKLDTTLGNKLKVKIIPSGLQNVKIEVKS